jgi:hypothetical protein
MSGVVVLPTFSEGEYPIRVFDPFKPGLLADSSARRAGNASDSGRRNKSREAVEDETRSFMMAEPQAGVLQPVLIDGRSVNYE